jgi:hypothetical protein
MHIFSTELLAAYQWTIELMHGDSLLWYNHDGEQHLLILYL